MLLNPALPAGSLRDPAWRPRLQLLAAFALVTVPAAWMAEFNPAVFFDAASLGATGSFLASFFPPALSGEFLLLIVKSTWQTIAIATCGMTLALAVAVPLAIAATRTLSISRIGRNAMGPAGRAARAAIRWLLIVLRSVPELVWALMFVRAVGLGDTAGVLAIALSYAGMVGKVFLEIFESQDAKAAEALLANGAGRGSAFLFGTLPACLPEMVSYTVYRWECAIRSSVILGFVGAGGLGMQMEISMKMLAGGEVIMFLGAFLLLVALADLVSKKLREWIG
jgi:phosphonate transport system permease protein